MPQILTKKLPFEQQYEILQKQKKKSYHCRSKTKEILIFAFAVEGVVEAKNKRIIIGNPKQDLVSVG